MQKILIIISSLFIFSSVLNAQKYDMSVGLRLGYPFGINAKMFLNEITAIEATVLSDGNDLGVVGLMDFHQPCKRNENWQWYYGAGAHLGLDIFDGQGISLGLDAIAGAEYIFKEAPISISIDWIPSLNLIKPEKENVLNLMQFGLSARYIF